ncbi:MAG TPA: glutamine--fructose-6-phosphate transaminase (isomerizing) [Methanocorpusculum sp.]|nr:glutamine--fructose-6-phosphate transaminase (isomerizing) [Methanocorpusculum sp.]
MCGIIGYFGFRNAADVCVDGLSRLEYRGYDSFGVAAVSPEKGLSLYKEAGKISVLRNNIKLDGTFGIGHTRWATHGVPSQKNAHPHLDCKGKIAVVHNGIIENYAALRRDLEKKGHVFASDTDTEVIPHLIEDVYDGDLFAAVQKILPRLEGSYAILVVMEGVSGIAAARKGSPLVIGLGDNEILFASDVLPVVQYTKDVLYLEDGDAAFAHLSPAGEHTVTIYQNKKPVKRELHKIEFDAEETKKGGFPHYMLKEIYEQPEVFSNTIASVSADRKSIISSFGSAHSVVITACGTSAHASMILAYLLETVCRIPARVILASEFKYTPTPNADVVIAVSQSGETADTIAALKVAKKNGAHTVCVTNVLGSSITRTADTVIYTRGGPEISVAATKTFIAQTAAFLEIVHVLSDSQKSRLGSVSSPLQKSLREVQRYLPEIVGCDVMNAVSVLKDASSLIYVGRGLGYPAALEGALKMKEISYIHAEGYAAGELKHGPFALLSETVPVVAVCFENSLTYPVMMSNLKEIKARNSPLVLIGLQGDSDAEDLADIFIPLPAVSETAAVVLASTVMQLIAYRTAAELGREIDYPKNLAKSVTVE